jgi:hypothetical protein
MTPQSPPYFPIPTLTPPTFLILKGKPFVKEEIDARKK